MFYSAFPLTLCIKLRFLHLIFLKYISHFVFDGILFHVNILFSFFKFSGASFSLIHFRISFSHPVTFKPTSLIAVCQPRMSCFGTSSNGRELYLVLYKNYEVYSCIITRERNKKNEDSREVDCELRIFTTGEMY